ncbi:penicillin-binding protein [Bacteroidetes bacterium endosymbiont of Geopemphigus sp.]|uniref:penicillin-binding protein n=1 Tax=Bacteroidetes bacterium endosymbiont of Geopemphigus sp. TaxID=2047937 RepID=UPI000CD1AF2C|nr:penicillin-binding protein [Bacteroidetes bacterium endosymbiont of Geopemphigus sp.]
MGYQRKHILYKSYLIGIGLLLFACSVAFALVKIQSSAERKKYEKFAEATTIRVNPLKAHRGNIYARDGSLLATSIIQYDIYLDLKTIQEKFFKENLSSLSDSLGNLFQKPAIYFYKKLSAERKKKNRYFPLTKGLHYNQYKRLKKFPIFNKGQIRGGLITEKRELRVHPLENIGARTIGYDDQRGKAGLEGAYSEWLSGQNGKRLEQRISFNAWKPLNVWNELEPEDGKDIYSTIDIGIQDITYNALLEQLKISNAAHGSAVLMEVKSGEIHAMVSLEKTAENTYENRRNFAVWEANEPGSTFKTMALLTALEDQKIDTSTQVNTTGGIYILHGKKVRDSKRGGYGVISAKKTLEVSSNIGMAKLIYENYKSHPEKFIRHLKDWHLDKKLEIDIPGEGHPYIPAPGQKGWSELTLPWMSFGYNLKMTPLQILSFYNAIANEGKMIKPLFIKEIRKEGQLIKRYFPVVKHPVIASKTSIKKIQDLLENAVKHGTAKKYYHPEYPYAGKTGTTQLNYWTKGKLSYSSSFAGYFPANQPKYSCIVVISKPKNGYYGAAIAAPVFDRIARSIYPRTSRKVPRSLQDNLWKKRFLATERKTFEPFTDYLPNLKGLSGKEIIPVLEKSGFRVEYQGIGKVLGQSIPAGEKIKKGQSIHLILEG